MTSYETSETRSGTKLYRIHVLHRFVVVVVVVVAATTAGVQVAVVVIVVAVVVVVVVAVTVVFGDLVQPKSDNPDRAHARSRIIYLNRLKILRTRTTSFKHPVPGHLCTQLSC